MMSRSSQVSPWMFLLALGVLAGCGPEVVVDDPGDAADDGAGGGEVDVEPAGSGGGSAEGVSSHGVTASASSGQAASSSGGGGEGGTDPGSGGAGGGAPRSEVCEQTAAVAIDAVYLDVDAWGPGESANVMVTLRSPIDHYQYPGVRIETDHPGVTSGHAENHLFGLVAGQSATLGLTFTAAEHLEPGTDVTFEVEVVTLVEECDGLDHTSFVVTLEVGAGAQVHAAAIPGGTGEPSFFGPFPHLDGTVGYAF